MQSKYFFEDKKDLIDQEHKDYKTHTEQTELTSAKCDHKGKVKPVPGGIRCACGAGWMGKDVGSLLNFFK